MDESRALIIGLTEHYSLTTIFIDALDECDSERRAELLENLEKILQESLSLVKIFVSSRDDQDIVLHLQLYPNLSLSSGRNKEDISSFVTAETESLIKRKKLLACIADKEKLRTEIIEHAIKNADGMFRWASLRLEMLCSITTKNGVRERLGRLPPSLEKLYLELYEKLTGPRVDADHEVIVNAFSWLLCAQRTLTSREFLTALSATPQRQLSQLTKEQVLELCSNMVVFDPTLDTFRFAHLSVREFLEKLPEYNTVATNALAAQTCLLDIISAVNSPVTRKFISNHRWISSSLDCLHELRIYSTVYWASHSQLAVKKRTDGLLRDLLLYFLFNESDPRSAIIVWAHRIEIWLNDDSLSRELLVRLRDTQAQEHRALFIASCFDFEEIVGDWAKLRDGLTNYQRRTPLQVAVIHGSCGVIRKLIKNGIAVIIDEVVKAAAGNKESGETAAGNYYNGEEVIRLLLEQRGAEVIITEEVVKAAAGNWYNGKK